MAKGEKMNVKRDFPIFENHPELVYLDSASTSQKPLCVITAEKDFYEKSNANIHRGIYKLSEDATRLYEKSRGTISRFTSADSKEIIFTRNATESLNLVAYSFAKQRLKPGDTILLTEMEHHSNIVPWQLIAREQKANLEYVKITKNGELDLEDAIRKIEKKPVLFAFTHVSNVLGTVNPVEKLASIARKNHVPVILDASQSVPHMPIDFHKLGVDFAAFSGHKMLGPTGIGCLYGKKELLEEMPPFIGGGDMIKTVTQNNATWNDIPWKFEAGTPNIAGVIGLAAAVSYLEKIGMKNVQEHNMALIKICLEEMEQLPFLKLYGPNEKCAVVSFNVGDIHAHDITSVLDDNGVAIRAGHHCCQPLMEKLNEAATCRASFHVYNDERDVEKMINALKQCKKVFNL